MLFLLHIPQHEWKKNAFEFGMSFKGVPPGKKKTSPSPLIQASSQAKGQGVSMPTPSNYARPHALNIRGPCWGGYRNMEVTFNYEGAARHRPPPHSTPTNSKHKQKKNRNKDTKTCPIKIINIPPKSPSL